MNSFFRTAAFDRWLVSLKDARGKARIIKRIRAAERGNFGDCRVVGGGITEMRIHYGPGYRVYFTRKADEVFVLLSGGTKSGQRRDIVRARGMARQLELD